MHRSRIGVVLIDHPPESRDAAAAFWEVAVRTAPPAPDALPDEEPFETLGLIGGGVELAVQRTGLGTTPRVHLDIETDDVPAEVARLVALGATVTVDHDGWAVLADPGGMPFCVVPVQTGEHFDTHGTTWP